MNLNQPQPERSIIDIFLSAFFASTLGKDDGGSNTMRLPFELAIKSVSSDKGVAAIDSLAAAMRFLSEGQSSEFNQIPVLNWSAYDEVVGKKTTPLLLAPIEGPLLMSGRKGYLPSVRRVVRAMGRAYQISNDMSFQRCAFFFGLGDPYDSTYFTIRKLLFHFWKLPQNYSNQIYLLVCQMKTSDLIYPLD